MTKKTIILTTLLLIISIFSSSHVYAYGSTFEDASDRSFNSSTYSYLSAGEVNMFHYEVASNGKGAYNLYSEGYTDVRVKLYEKNRVWPFERYDLIDEEDNNNYYNYNFHIRVDLDNYEDYYVRVDSGATGDTGGYYLYFEENLDEKSGNDFGSWKKDSSYDVSPISTITFITGEENLLGFYASLDQEFRVTWEQAFFSAGVAAAQAVTQTWMLAYAGVSGPQLYMIAIGSAVATSLTSYIMGPLIENMMKDSLISAADGYWQNGRLYLPGAVEVRYLENFQHGEDYTVIGSWNSNTMYGTERERGSFIIHD